MATNEARRTKIDRDWKWERRLMLRLLVNHGLHLHGYPQAGDQTKWIQVSGAPNSQRYICTEEPERCIRGKAPVERNNGTNNG